MAFELFQGDCQKVLRDFADGVVDAVVTDPPYELSFMSKRWDATGVAFDPATWREVFRVLKPGGYLLAFGGCRTWHRMACAIEDAGFYILDSIDWVFATGWPKSRNSLKPAHEPIVFARKEPEGTVAENKAKHGTGALNVDACRTDTTPRSTGTINPHATSGVNGIYGQDNRVDRQQRYDANKPSGRWPSNVVFSHTSSCELIGTKVVKGAAPFVGDGSGQGSRPPGFGDVGALQGDGVPSGRSYTDENGNETVEDWRCADDCPVAELDRQSGIRKSGAMKAGTKRANRKGDVYGVKSEIANREEIVASEGGASRFFPCFRYETKASKKDRGVGNNHATVKPQQLLRWLVRLVVPQGGVCLDPFMGSGTTGVACVLEGFDFAGIELEEPHMEICRSRIADAVERAKAGK